MSGPVLFLKAQVKGHTRRQNGRTVFVSPYRTLEAALGHAPRGKPLQRASADR